MNMHGSVMPVVRAQPRRFKRKTYARQILVEKTETIKRLPAHVVQ